MDHDPNRPCDSCGAQFLQATTTTTGAHLCRRCQQALELVTTGVPPEIWTTIFNLLEVSTLLRVRSVCQHWKRIVDGSGWLRGQILARLRSKTLMDEGFNPGVPPVGHVAIEFSEIGSVGGWWGPAFGQRLVSIELYGCKISKGTFWEMLRSTSVLRDLKLSEVSYLEAGTEGDATVDRKFQLTNLEKLVLDTDYEKSHKTFLADALEVFPGVCPRLRYLAFHGYSEKKPIIRMIKAVETTLQGLKLDATKKILEALANLKQLRLRHVAILRCTSYDPESLGRFFRAQLDVVDLSICEGAIAFLSHPEFTQLKLIRLKIEMMQDFTLNIGQLPTLEYLEITAYYCGTPTIKFGHCHTPNLRELRFFRFHFVGNSLPSYLVDCPKLQLLRFGQVIIDKSVYLGILPSEAFPALRTLKIDQSNIPQIFLLELFPRSLNIQHLELIATSSVEDHVVQYFCHLLKRLKRLSLVAWVTDAAALHIINHAGRELRQLDYYDVWPLKEETKSRLLDHFRPLSCAVRFRFSTKETYRLDLMQFN